MITGANECIAKCTSINNLIEFFLKIEKSRMASFQIQLEISPKICKFHYDYGLVRDGIQVLRNFSAFPRRAYELPEHMRSCFVFQEPILETIYFCYWNRSLFQCNLLPPQLHFLNVTYSNRLPFSWQHQCKSVLVPMKILWHLLESSELCIRRKERIGVPYVIP